ncbi:MAG: tetratricopeptide repeat protein [Phenylobacterium sp.]|uniref:CHAT domain-containing tetratricopeptide repeat protein n=1 Tax=Phenylobacterium sp. TaxID=1871053 RepID=UPI0025DAC6DE|nr:CHAT domain-containing tetratricopeptide repeat protein [Phenylobacterium sp.]MBI1196281.1 tetratricopeptide repeat protein [Phenylobacterium sp.]
MLRRRWRAGLLACALSCIAGAAWPADAPTSPLAPKEAARWQALVAKAEAARAAGDWKALEKVTRRRVEIEARAYGPDSTVAAASYSWIGQALAHRGREAEAEPFYRRALEIDRRTLGARHPQTLVAVSNLAGLLERQRRLEEAEPLRRMLLDASRAVFGAKTAQAAAASAALADLLRAQDRPVEAEPLFREALGVDTRLFGENDPRLAGDLDALGATLDDLGRHAEAEPLLRRALALRRRALGDHDLATARACARMAANLDAQGRHAEAEPLHRMALKTDRELRGRRHPATAAADAALGANLDAQGRPKEAEPLLREALDIRRRLLGDRDPATAASYGALAANLAARGETAEAERLHRRALAILLVARGDRDPATASAFVALAGDLAAAGRAHEAEPLLRKALQIRRLELGEGHPATGAAYDALADLQHQRDDDVQAEAMAARAVGIVRAQRHAELRAAGSDPEAAIRRARAAEAAGDADAPVFRRYVRLAWLAAAREPDEAPRLRDAAFTAAQDLSASPAAQALAQTAARAALGRKLAKGDARVRQALAGQAKRIEDQMVRALPKADPAEAARIGVALDAVGRELASLDARLQRDNPRYAEMATPGALSVAEVQRRLRAREGLLLVTPVDDDVYVFAVSRRHAAWNRIEGGAADLARRVRALRCELDDRSCGDRAAEPDAEAALPAFDLGAAHALYRELFGPVEAALAGVDTLYVTTSGATANLPLGLLVSDLPPDGQTGLAGLRNAQWLADRYALITLPSAATLRAAPPARRPAARTWSFVGFGDPDFSAADAAAQPSFEPLPGAADELRAMARTLGAAPGHLRIGQQATETAIKTAPDLAGADVVAIATHGLLSHEIAGLAQPGLVLTPPARPSAQDDGVLTASEAAALDLSADWVILSACNTASGDGAPGADSLSGLARAFLYAGARALLVSHWRVFDDATAALTVETLAIQRAHPRLGKAQALQQAERAVRTGRRPDGSRLPGWRPEWAHPAYWAPFVLIAASS